MIKRKHMPCGDCGCESGCCDGPFADIQYMSFSSLDGLHPISISSNRINFAVDPTSLPIQSGPTIPMNAGNNSCLWTTASGIDFHPLGPYNTDELMNGECCFSGILIPTVPALSTPVEGRFEYSVSAVGLRTELFKRNAAADQCTASGAEWEREEEHILGIGQRYQMKTQRLVAAVQFYACYTDIEGERKLALKLRVWYKDLMVSQAFTTCGYGIKRLANSGHIRYNGDPFNPACVTVNARSESTTWTGDNPLLSPPSWFGSGDIDVSHCLDCSTGNNNSTCNLEYIDRTIYLDPDCDPTGTHTFPGDNTNTPKYERSVGYCGVVPPGGGPPVLPCEMALYAPSGCAFTPAGMSQAPSTRLATSFEYPYTHVTSERVLDSESVSETPTGEAVPMYWWDEDWEITLS